MLQIPLEHLLIFDIETVPVVPNYNQLTDDWQSHWNQKIRFLINEENSSEQIYDQKAGVMAEFSKIVCISMGYFVFSDNKLQLRIKSFAGFDEVALLNNWMAAVKNMDRIHKQWYLSGHNIKEFDIPFICRRIFINNLAIPEFLDFQNLKPWETRLFDTFQYWRFGDYKYFTSLNLLAACLNIPSPKDDIDGSMVAKVYWEEKNIERIVTYCQKDVVTVANIIRRFRNETLLIEEQVFIAE